MVEFAIALQAGRGEYIEAAVIASLLFLNATLGFVKEGRATAAITALKKRLAPTAWVRRDGAWAMCPASELVPGDTVRLPLGALVPADARLVTGSVMVDHSMITGESVPVDAVPGSDVYAGALVRRGQAIAEVTATGSRTYFGKAAELVRIARASSTEQKAILSATRNLMFINGGAALLIIAYASMLSLPSADLISLALTALLATIPVALPATFTLSAAVGAQALARRGVLLTRLSAAHEAAAMDVLCADKTGTLTLNALEVVDVRAMPGFDRRHVLGLAALASSEGDHDPIDGAIRKAAAKERGRAVTERSIRFIPFDPATRTAEAFVLDQNGHELRIVKGAFEAIAAIAEVPAETRHLVDELAAPGNRIIAVATGRSMSLRLAGLIAISDPPREDSAELVAALQGMGVRTLMITGDSAVTAATIAENVGIAGGVCPPERHSDDQSTDDFGVFARIIPEEKFRLVKALQNRGHVVGMCGDGVNDAPALRQAQIGIAVSTATDAAKAAASMVLTEPGLSGVVYAVREGRIGFQRLLTYTLNMLLKKIEIVLFLAIGLGLTGHAVMTPALMVLMLMTNDFLAMSLTTDRASPAPAPSRWRMQNVTGAAIALGVCKLLFSISVLAVGKYQFGLGTPELQTLAFVTLVFGAQSALYVVRERRRMWSSKPDGWVLVASATDIAIVSVLAFFGMLMAALPWQVLTAILLAACGFAVVLDQIKCALLTVLKVE